MNFLEKLAAEAKKKRDAIAAQLNMNDGGKTYDTQINNKPVGYREPVKLQQAQQVQNSPHISQARKDSINGMLNAPKTRFNPATATFSSLGKGVADITKGIAGAGINTLQLGGDVARLGAAKVTDNRPAMQNAKKAWSSDANNNFLWNEGFNKTADIMSGAWMANKQADASKKANENYGNTIANAYGNTPQARAWADSNIAANTQADQAQQLNRYGLTPTSSVANTAIKTGLPIASTGAQIALNAVGGGAGAKVGAQLGEKVAGQVAKQTARQTVNTVGKQALGFGTANAGISVADTLAGGGSAADAAKAGVLGLATGAAMPAAGAVAGGALKGATNKLRTTSLIRPTKLSDLEVNHISQMLDNRGKIADESIYNNGMAAAKKLGIDPGTPDGVMQLHGVVGQHTTFNTQAQQRAQNRQELIDGVKNTAQAIKNKLPETNQRGSILGPQESPVLKKLGVVKQETKPIDQIINIINEEAKRHKDANSFSDKMVRDGLILKDKELPDELLNARRGVDNARRNGTIAQIQQAEKDASKALQNYNETLRLNSPFIINQVESGGKYRVVGHDLGDISKQKYSPGYEPRIPETRYAPGGTISYFAEHLDEIPKTIEALKDAGSYPYKSLDEVVASEYINMLNNIRNGSSPLKKFHEEANGANGAKISNNTANDIIGTPIQSDAPAFVPYDLPINRNLNIANAVNEAPIEKTPTIDASQITDVKQAVADGTFAKAIETKEAQLKSRVKQPGQTDEQFANEYLKNNLAEATADYKDRTMKEFGGSRPNIVSADESKFIIPDFGPTKSAPYHPAASQFAKDYYKQLLADPSTKDRPVLITAGGAGAGKSTGLQLLRQENGDLGHYAAVNDTNLTNLESATSRIEPALESGRQVRILFTYRDPVEAFVNGNIPRAARTGRVVPISIHADTHVGALDTIKQVAEKYKDNPDVSIAVVDNSRGKGNETIVPIDFLSDKSYNKSELTDTLRKELDNAQQQNTVSQDAYSSYLGLDSSNKELGRSSPSREAETRPVETNAGVTPELLNRVEQLKNLKVNAENSGIDNAPDAYKAALKEIKRNGNETNASYPQIGAEMEIAARKAYEAKKNGLPEPQIAGSHQLPPNTPSVSRATEYPRSQEAQTLNTENMPQSDPQLQINKDSQSLPDNTPTQRKLEESTAPFSNQQEALVKEYTDMLKSMDDSGSGGDMVPNGEGGYKRVTTHSKFYSDYFKEYGRKPSKAAFAEEAARQLRAGTADEYVQKAFNDLNDPEWQALANSYDNNGAGAPEMHGFTQLALDPLKEFRAKIKVQSPAEKNIPVKKVTQVGAVVTETNVNPNIKKGEKRYSVDSNGELIPDENGAYHLFTDEDGHVTGFRIGKQFYDAGMLGDLNDVNGYGSVFATQRRNIERAFGKDTGEKVNQFLVDYQQGQTTKMVEYQLALKNKTQELANYLGIDFAKNKKQAKKVSAAIQNYGENEIGYVQLVDDFGKPMADKIVKADKWFKTQYDSMLNKMNETLSEFGYEPVPKRKNYYTHFQDPGLWQKFGLKMDEVRSLVNPTMQDATPDMVRGRISNTLAGQSEFLEPNKRFNPFAQRRLGDTHTADAFQSFEKYLTPTLNNIYMTPAISRARVLAKALTKEADINNKDINKTLIQMKEWANHLAGKSSRMGDRQLADTMTGGKYLKAAAWVQKKVGQNTIVGNLATAVMQPVVGTQAVGQFGVKNMLLATLQEVNSAHAKDAAIRASGFMKRRYADLTPVTAGKTERMANVANTPLKVVEETTARIVWNAAHNQALEKGMAGKKAILWADAEAEKTLSGRSLGEKPEVFRAKLFGPVTMYQLEVNNFWQQFGKEMALGHGKSGKVQALKVMASMYAFNLVLQQVTGKQVGFNPIDDAIKSYEETQKQEKSKKDKAIAIGQQWLGDAVDNAPFVGPLANATIGDKNIKKWLGVNSNTGRFGANSPLSSAASSPEMLVSPFGSSQIKKTYKGAMALRDGGLYDKKGNKTVDIPKTPVNAMKLLAFGPSATKEAGTYYNNLSVNKVDQKQVPNQVGTVAGTQSLQGLSKDQQEMMRDTPAEKQDSLLATFIKKNKADRDKKAAKEDKKGLKAANMSVDEIKADNEKKKLDFEAQFDPDDYTILNMSKADRKKVIDAGIKTQAQLNELDKTAKDLKKKLGMNISDDSSIPKNIDKLPKTVQDYYNNKTPVSGDDKTAWLKEPADDNNKKLIEQVAYMRPDGLPELPKTNHVADLYADYKTRQDKEKWSPTRENTEKLKLLREAYKSQLDSNDKYWYGASQTELADAIDANDLKNETMDKLVALDDLLVSIKGSAQIPNKLRRALGYGDIPKYTSTGTTAKKASAKKAKTMAPSSFSLPNSLAIKYRTTGASLARSAKI